jgi:hypothetical protein
MIQPGQDTMEILVIVAMPFVQTHVSEKALGMAVRQDTTRRYTALRRRLQE